MRRYGSSIAIGVATLIAAHVGYVGVRQTRHAAALERELEQQDRASRGSIDKLSRQLDAALRESEELRAWLAQSRDQEQLLALDLQAATARVAVLERLSDEPPALEVEFTPLDGLYSVLVSAHNPGRRPVRIFAAEGSVWLDGEPGGHGRSDLLVSVDPEGSADFFEYGLLGQDPARVATGEISFRGALCLSYERSLGELTSAWTAHYWFEYQAALGAIAVLRRESWPLDVSSPGCDLQTALPPW